MTRKSYVQINGELIDKDLLQSEPASTVYVVGDIPAYKSMITGEMIDGRAAHRAHLKTHGVIEVGNEVLKPRPVAPASGRKEQIARAVYEKLRY